MPGPAEIYSASELDAHAWAREHFDSPRGVKSNTVFTAEDDFLSGLRARPLFAAGRGRALEQPLFKQPPLPAPSSKEPFALSWGEEAFTLPAAPSSHTHHVHHNETSEDDDPSLALSDFAYQFTKWSTPSSAPKATELTASQPAKREILLYDNTAEGHRTAIDLAILNGYIDANNEGQLVNLMRALASTKNTKIKDDSTEIERSVGAGGAVLGEVKEEAESDKAGGVRDQAGQHGDTRAQHVNREGPVKYGRLKGKARKEAKKAGKK